MGVRSPQEPAADIHAVGAHGNVVGVHREGDRVGHRWESWARPVGGALAKAGVDHVVFGDVIEVAVMVITKGAILSRNVLLTAPVPAVAIEEGIVAGVWRSHLLGDGPNAVAGIGHGVVSGRPEVIASCQENPVGRDVLIAHVHVEGHIDVGDFSGGARTVVPEVEVVEVNVPTVCIGRSVCIELAIEFQLKNAVPSHAREGGFWQVHAVPRPWGEGHLHQDLVGACAIVDGRELELTIRAFCHPNVHVNVGHGRKVGRVEVRALKVEVGIFQHSVPRARVKCGVYSARLAPSRVEVAGNAGVARTINANYVSSIKGGGVGIVRWGVWEGCRGRLAGECSAIRAGIE